MWSIKAWFAYRFASSGVSYSLNGFELSLTITRMASRVSSSLLLLNSTFGVWIRLNQPRIARSLLIKPLKNAILVPKNWLSGMWGNNVFYKYWPKDTALRVLGTSTSNNGPNCHESQSHSRTKMLSLFPSASSVKLYAKNLSG